MMKIIQAIKDNQRFLISTHVNPDPDALCSELAIAIYLRSLGKTVVIMNDQPFPERYRFLPGSNRVRHYKPNTKLNYDVAILLDCGEFNRIGRVADIIRSDKIIINIDHHITNDQFGDLNLVQPKASSTAEVLYDLFKRAKYPLNKSLALHLYAGIMTDTGSFRHENTTARTHVIVSELIKFKFSTTDLYKKIYEAVAYRDLKELTKVLSGFNLDLNNQAAFVILSKKVLSKFSKSFDLRDMAFKYLRSIQSVHVVVILTEIERSKTRVNLRSTDQVDVAKLAHHFQGGGHRQASGCVINANVAQSRKKILNQLRKVL